MNEHKKDGRKSSDQGWSRLVIDHKPVVVNRNKDLVVNKVEIKPRA